MPWSRQLGGEQTSQTGKRMSRDGGKIKEPVVPYSLRSLPITGTCGGGQRAVGHLPGVWGHLLWLHVSRDPQKRGCWTGCSL